MNRADTLPPPRRHTRPPRTAAALGLLPLAAIPLIAGALHFIIGAALPDYMQRLAMEVGIAIVLTVSLNLVNGFTGQFSIGHAAFATVGAYSAGAVTYYGSIHLLDSAALTDARLHLQTWLFIGGCLLGGVAAACAGWLVGLPSLRLRGDYLAIVTLGFGEIVRVLLQQTNPQLSSRAEIAAAPAAKIWPPPMGGALGFTGLPPMTSPFWAYLAAGVTVLFAYRLKQSSYGRAMLAIRENEIAAEAMGVNITRMKVWAFVFAAFFAGIGGGLSAHLSGNPLQPSDSGFIRSFDLIIIVVLGGLGSISGAVLAALLVTVLQYFLTPLAAYRPIIFALVLILLMIFRPQGLFGVREVWEMLRRPTKKGDA